MLDRLAAFIHRRRRHVLWGSLVVVLVAGFFGGPVFGLLDSGDDFDDPQAEAPPASADIARATGADASPDLVALVRLGAPADSPEAQRKLDRVAAALRDPGVANVDPLRARRQPRAGLEGRALLLRRRHLRQRRATACSTACSRLERMPGVTVGGGELAQEQVGEQVSEDIARAELLAFPILFLLSLFVFRSVVAALLPLAVGGATIMLSFLAMRSSTRRSRDVDLRAEPHHRPRARARDRLLAVHGLALPRGARTRARHRGGAARDDDDGRADRCCSRRSPSRRRSPRCSSSRCASCTRWASAGSICALAAALVSLTLLPAILAALGPRVNALSPKRWQAALHREAAGERSGFWYRLSQRSCAARCRSPSAPRRY